MPKCRWCFSICRPGKAIPTGLSGKPSTGSRNSSRRRWPRKDRVAYIDAANYGQHLDQLKGLRPDHRSDRREDGVEGRSVSPDRALHLADGDHRFEHLRPVDQPPVEGLPEALRSRFCGIHFFNPPRYMHLVELIATRTTDPALLDNLESWLVSRLGKGIVRALDTPNFVANRVGVFSILAVMHHTERSASGSTSSTRSPVRSSAARRAPPIAPPTWSVSTRWRTSSRRCRTPCRTIPGTATTACRPGWRR
jgi:hypothetical protein